MPDSPSSPNIDRSTSGLGSTSFGSNGQENRSLTLEESNSSKCCCDLNTRKFSSLPYGALIFITGAIFLVAAAVKTDDGGIQVDRCAVYRYLTVVLIIAIIWMATTIGSRCFSAKVRNGWLATHIEPRKQLIPTRLLVGVMFFGLGSSFLTMVEFLEYVSEIGCPSKDVSMALYYIVRTLFIYTQLYFFYKLSCHTEKLLIFGHFQIMHLIAVNMATWLITFVYDSAEELNDDLHEDSNSGKRSTAINSTLLIAERWGLLLQVSDTNATSDECYKAVESLKSTAESMEPYLYTCTMEYCLISAALLLTTWLSLRSSAESSADSSESDREGKPSADTGYRSCDDSGGESSMNERRGKEPKYSKRRKKAIPSASEVFSDIEIDEGYELVESPRSMPEVGTLWRFWFVVGLAYIPAFTAVIFNLYFSDNVKHDRLVYIGMQFMFLMSIFVPSAYGIRQLGEIECGETHSKVDFILLGVSLLGVFFLDTFIILASICELNDDTSTAIFLMLTNAIEILSSVFFTLFVRKALECELPAETNDKSAMKAASNIREAVSFLFVLNICFWGMYTFEVKKSAKVLELVETFYTKKVWFYLSHFAYPFAVFFHFHGAVCMFEVLSHYSIGKRHMLLTSGTMSASTTMKRSHRVQT